MPDFGAHRSSPKRIQGPDQQNLRLQFRNKLALPLFTGSKVEGEQGSAIHVVLQHAGTGQVVTTGPEASAKLDIVVLEGDFTAEDEENWTQEEFENFEVRERDGKRPLLTGDLTVALKDGVGTLGELTFTDNSSWIRSRKFRLGVKIASGFCEGMRIREAKTEAFTVKDHRGERMVSVSHLPKTLASCVSCASSLQLAGDSVVVFLRLTFLNILRIVETILCAPILPSVFFFSFFLSVNWKQSEGMICLLEPNVYQMVSDVNFFCYDVQFTRSTIRLP